MNMISILELKRVGGGMNMIFLFLIKGFRFEF